MSANLDEVKSQKSKFVLPWTWFSSRISAKLSAIMILVVMIPLLGLGIVLTMSAEKAVKESVRRDHQEIAKRTAHEVSLYVERPLELLETTGAMVAINQTNARQQETVLVELSIMYPIFEEVLSVDTSGKTLASSNPGKPPEFRPREEALARILKKDTYVSSVYLSKDYLPYVDAAIPCFYQGKVVGALFARINLRGMWDIIDEIRIGKTGRAYLVSHHGILIAHPDKKKVLQNINLSHDPAVSQVLQDKIGTIEETDKEGSWLVSYAPITGEFSWGIVVEQQTQEAYKLVEYILWSTFIAGFLAVLLSITVSVIASRQVVKPVRSLDFWSRRISIGDFEYSASHRARDELGRLFIAFRRMRDRLREAREQEYLAMIGTASSALAHKIKNTIVSLKILADLFSSRRHDEKFLDQIQLEFPRAVGHLEHILRQLSKVASEYSLQPVKVNVQEIAARLAKKFNDVAVSKKINLRLICETDSPSVDGDAERLSDVFENLIVNAIDAMPNGGEFTFSLRPGRGRIPHPKFLNGDEIDFLEIAAKDTGVGISQERLESVFKPFVTTKGGGMGIGLTVVKKIIQQHGGSIRVESEVGKGTSFIILLPQHGAEYGVFK